MKFLYITDSNHAVYVCFEKPPRPKGIHKHFYEDMKQSLEEKGGIEPFTISEVEIDV